MGPLNLMLQRAVNYQAHSLKRETLPILSAQGNLRRQTGLPMASVKL